MEQQATTFTRAILKNSTDPKLAWLLFKRLALSSPSALCLRAVPIVARSLAAAKMRTEIDSLRQILATLSNPETSHSCLLSLIQTLSDSPGLAGVAVSHFKSLRAQFPEKIHSVSLYNSLLRSSLRGKGLDSLSWLYKDMVDSGVKPETYTCNLLIAALCDSGHLEDAREVFDKMRVKGCCPNEFGLGILVHGYCRAGLADLALELVDKMTCVSPNRVVYNTLISSFCRERRTNEAEKLVERMRKENMLPDVVTFNSRISALCKSGEILEASRIFRDMHSDGELGLPRPNIVTYNLVLEGLCKERMLGEARDLFESMKVKGDFVRLDSYNIWLLALTRNGEILETSSLLKEMVDRGMEPNICTYNIMMDGLCRSGMFSDAQTVIRLMRSSGISPDTITYTSLLHGYCNKGKIVEANNVLQEMMANNCVPNTHTCNTLLNSLWKEGKVSEAEELLQKMNERGYGIDIVTCNIVLDGLCNNGKLDKAIEIASDMWIHGSSALGRLGNSFDAIFDESYDGRNCKPDLITYSIIMNGLCKVGKLNEAKAKLAEMMKKKLHPDSVIYNTFIHSYCKEEKISSAFRVLKDMEKKGCNKTLETYNSLILGLGSKGEIFEIYGLLDEMKERGVSPNTCTYNNMIRCFCKGGRVKEAASLLDEMLQIGVSPNVTSFEIIIKALCKASEFKDVDVVFNLALTVCGHRETLYSTTFNGLFSGGEISRAKMVFKGALDRNFHVGNFLYKDLIRKLCEEEKLEEATKIINVMLDKGGGFDPAAFLPVIDGLNKNRNKHEADQLAERMLEMASEGGVKNKARVSKKNVIHRSTQTDWQALVHRDDGSGIALETLKRVIQKGWGRKSISDLQPQEDEFLDY